MFADWLEEHGERDWSEFIRIQVGQPRGIESFEFKSREQILWDRLGVRLFNDLGVVFEKGTCKLGGSQDTSFIVPKVGALTWRRGFASKVSIGTSDFLNLAPCLFIAAPIMSVTLTECWSKVVNLICPLCKSTLNIRVDGFTCHEASGGPYLKGRVALICSRSRSGPSG